MDIHDLLQEIIWIKRLLQHPYVNGMINKRKGIVIMLRLKMHYFMLLTMWSLLGLSIVKRLLGFGNF
jgi:hypothetical protein